MDRGAVGDDGGCPDARRVALPPAHSKNCTVAVAAAAAAAAEDDGGGGVVVVGCAIVVFRQT